MVIVSMEPQGGLYASRLLVYDLGSAELRSGASVLDGLVMDFYCNGDRVLSLCDKRFTMTDLEGDGLLDLSYGNLYLHDYALTGGDFCALLLGRYQAGNICTLTTYDLDGQKIASMELTEEVLALADGAGSELGTGGMVTKLRAASMCMAAGCDMIITNGQRPEDLYRIAAGEAVGTRFFGKTTGGDTL